MGAIGKGDAPNTRGTLADYGELRERRRNFEGTRQGFIVPNAR